MKNPQAQNPRVGEVGLKPSTIVANGLDGTAFLSFLALGLFLGRCGLLGDVSVTAILVASEIVGGRFAAQVAINALVVHEKFARHVFRIFICDVSHKMIVS
jgi:hypothetical protein